MATYSPPLGSLAAHDFEVTCRLKAAELATELLADNFPDLAYWLKLANAIEAYLRGEEGPSP